MLASAGQGTLGLRVKGMSHYTTTFPYDSENTKVEGRWAAFHLLNIFFQFLIIMMGENI